MNINVCGGTIGADPRLISGAGGVWLGNAKSSVRVEEQEDGTLSLHIQGTVTVTVSSPSVIDHLKAVIAAASVIVLFCSPLQAQTVEHPNTGLFTAALMGSGAMDGLDMSLTVQAIRLSGAHETNPIMRHPVSLTALKSGMVVLFPVGQLRLHKRHPKIAMGMVILNIGVKGWVSHHNWQVLQQERRR